MLDAVSHGRRLLATTRGGRVSPETVPSPLLRLPSPSGRGVGGEGGQALRHPEGTRPAMTVGGSPQTYGHASAACEQPLFPCSVGAQRAVLVLLFSVLGQDVQTPQRGASTLRWFGSSVGA
jgi:hypothetical protein